MNNKKKLFNSALVYTLGNFMLRGISFFTIPIFTRILTTQDYGIFSIFSTWVGVLSIFIGLGINGTIGVAKGNMEDDEYREYLSSTLFLATISFAVILAISLIFGGQIGSLINLSKILVIILVIQSFCSFIISFITAKYTFDQEPKKYLMLSFVTTIINVIVSIVLITNMNSEKYIGRILGGLISVLFISLFLYIKELKNGKKLISLKHWKFCLPIAIPIIFHNLSHLILNQADRVMLQQVMGDDSVVGIYSFVYNLAIMLNIVNMSINSAWVAWYFEALKNKVNEEIEKMAKVYIYIFTALSSMFILGAPEVIKILAPKQYWGGIKLLPLIILGYYFVFLYTFGVNYEFYKKKTKFIATGTIIAAIVNIGVNAILIPKIGMYGAAIATLVAYIILFIMHEIIVRMIMKHKDFPFIYYIYSIVIVAITTLIAYILMEVFIIRWSIIAVILILIGLNVQKYVKENKKKKITDFEGDI